PATQANLWSTVLRSPAALYVLHVPEPFDGADQLALSPDGRTLVVGNDAGLVTFYDSRSHHRIGSVVPPGFGPKQGVSSLAFSHDGRMLAVGGADTIAMLAPATRRPARRSLDVSGSGVFRLAFSPDDRTLAVAQMTGYSAYSVTRFDL